MLTNPVIHQGRGYATYDAVVAALVFPLQYSQKQSGHLQIGLNSILHSRVKYVHSKCCVIHELKYTYWNPFELNKLITPPFLRVSLW